MSTRSAVIRRPISCRLELIPLEGRYAANTPIFFAGLAAATSADFSPVARHQKLGLRLDSEIRAVIRTARAPVIPSSRVERWLSAAQVKTMSSQSQFIAIATARHWFSEARFAFRLPIHNHANGPPQAQMTGRAGLAALRRMSTGADPRAHLRGRACRGSLFLPSLDLRRLQSAA